MEQKGERKLVRMLDDLDHVHRFRVSKKGKSLKREKRKLIEEVGGRKNWKMMDQPE